MKNRYGVQYSFAKVEDSLYQFRIPESEMEYMRMGSREGQDEIDLENLGMFDPSGGPYIEIGSKIYVGCNALTVTRIMSREDGLFVEAE